jgi:hypothetical protein
MSNDDRLNRYLADQASAITLPPADPTGVARRGARRRTRRRGAVILSTAAVAALAISATVIDTGGDDSSVTSFGLSPASPSTYDWTVVDPLSGLGYARGTAALEDGSIYSLSTAPGQTGDAPADGGHLYRTTDGADWQEVALPSGITPSSLAGQGNTLYALGTAPTSSGGRDLVLAATQDGAATWQHIELPDDVTALDAAFPGQIVISQPSVAALDADHLVAAVTVQANPDVPALLPDVDFESGELGYEASADGVTVFEQEGCTDAGAYAERCTFSGSGAPVASTTTVAAAQDPAAADAEKRAEDLAAQELSTPERKVHSTYTWDELGLDPALRDHVAGRTYVYRTQDGEHFEAASVPDALEGTNVTAVATEEGYTLFAGDWTSADSSIRVLTSADGGAFTEAAGSPLAGSMGEAGVLGGRPAVAVFDREGGTDVRVLRPDGSWATLTLAESGAFGGEVAFGPLGLAAVVWEPVAGSETTVPHLLHSTDGEHLSSVPLEDELGTAAPNVIGLSVTADAIFVRIGGPVDDDPNTPPVQHVLVGTPA